MNSLLRSQLTCCKLLLLSLALSQNAWHQVGAQQKSSGGSYSTTDSFDSLMADLKAKDTCRTIYTSRLHGFDVQEYTVTTSDRYILKLHRLIHPEDQIAGGPKPGAKKPYLLLHGLVGSSASFVRNVDQNYLAPERTFDIDLAVHEILNSKQTREQEASHFAMDPAWKSTADFFHAAFDGDTWDTLDELSWKNRVTGHKPRRHFASLNPIDYDVDSTIFGSRFKQHYKKWNLPNSSKSHISNSLAFTLSNLGYDVWLLNLRGNHYSRGFNGPGSASNTPEYWDFDADKLVREDLLASINFVRKTTRFEPPMGLVSYSYSSIYVLGLLTKFPDYQLSLQPVVMMAPTLLTAGSNRGNSFKLFLQGATKLLTSHNGPFPALASGEGRSKGRDNKLVRAVCSLPLASTLCRLLETVLYGRVKSAKDLVFDSDQLVKRDVDCGQTSSAVLRQIMSNMGQQNIDPKYQPTVKARNRLMTGGRVRRSVMLVRSDADSIATPVEVGKIRDTALTRLALTDFVINVPEFGHTDFLFSKRNQYLVNGEIGRMVSLFDYMIYRRVDNYVREH